MVAVVEDDLFTADFINDPYTYFHRLGPLVEERVANLGEDLLSVLASGEKADIHPRRSGEQRYFAAGGRP